ncbi:Nuclear intron maturase 4, mitochondrial [Linum perenne]
MVIIGRLSRVCNCKELRRVMTQRSINFSHVNHTAGASMERLHGLIGFSTVSAASGTVDNGSRKMTLAAGLADLVAETSGMDAPGTADKDSRTMTLARDLADLVKDTPNPGDKVPESRIKLKRYLELRVKKRVKENYVDGKFENLMTKVIANPETLQDAYSSVMLNANVDITSESCNVCFRSMAEELSNGTFNIKENTTSISTRREPRETLVLPNLKLTVVQEAIRMTLEVVYRPHFSKISHGSRSGRSHRTALKYITKEFANPDRWFTVDISKKLDVCVLAKLNSLMEEKIDDPSLLEMIQGMFDAEVLNLEFGGFPKGHGLPQEGVLSPILMNIYLDAFDREYYRLLLKYEALNPGLQFNEEGACSKLRTWFKRQMKSSENSNMDEKHSGPRIFCCRFMDELLFAVSGPEDVALDFKTEVLDYLHDYLHLDASSDVEISPGRRNRSLRFLGTLVRRDIKETPAVKAVHKLKEKVKLFTLQKQEAWDRGIVRIGKKSLGHGLRKVKESEIRHLADPDSLLNQISCFRKPGMETDHWYKHLVKVWVQNLNPKVIRNEQLIFSSIVEPALPNELRESFFEFQKCAERYVRSETATTLALLPGSSTPAETVTKIFAPVYGIQKRLFRYGLTTFSGHARAVHLLVLQDDNQIIDWFHGIICRWLRWYSYCDNFVEVEAIIQYQVRKSCIRTLAAKHRIYENDIEKRFDAELSKISPVDELDEGMVASDSSECQPEDDFGSMAYGVSYSGLSLLSLARITSDGRPCNCFIMGCSAAAPAVYTLHVMERQKFPGWKTGFSTCIHPSLNKRRIGLCEKHLKDLYLGQISLQSVDFGSWK